MDVRAWATKTLPIAVGCVAQLDQQVTELFLEVVLGAQIEMVFPVVRDAFPIVTACILAATTPSAGVGREVVLGNDACEILVR